jgi:hypothetical protein
MEYTKPEVLTRELAINAIQAVGPKDHTHPDSQDAAHSSPTAYEADE